MCVYIICTAYGSNDKKKKVIKKKVTEFILLFGRKPVLHVRAKGTTYIHGRSCVCRIYSYTRKS